MTFEWDSPRALTYISGRCEESKDHTWGINFYYKNTMAKGKVSLNIFEKDKGKKPIVIINLDVAKLHEMLVNWKRLLQHYAPENTIRIALTESKWDKAEKAYKTTQIGNLAYGFDKEGNPKIGLTYGKDRYQFLLQDSSLYDKNVVRKEDPEAMREVLVEGIIMILQRGIHDIFETQSYPHVPYDQKSKGNKSSSAEIEIEDDIPF